MFAFMLGPVFPDPKPSSRMTKCLQFCECLLVSLEIIKILWGFFLLCVWLFLVLKIHKIVRIGNYNAKNINQRTTG